MLVLGYTPIEGLVPRGCRMLHEPLWFILNGCDDSQASDRSKVGDYLGGYWRWPRHPEDEGIWIHSQGAGWLKFRQQKHQIL